MSSVFVSDALPGRATGRRVSKSSSGWDGAFGTHFRIDLKEKLIGVTMIQTNNPDRQVDRDFENAVVQAIVE
jgi:CubicO group peptidase (beta-lactamase class C family)